MRAFGAPAEIIEAFEAEQCEQCKHFEVWPENWPIVEMFLRLETQWRVGFGGRTGLDYVAVRWMFEIHEISDPRAMLEGLQVMERAALEALAERAGE